MMKKTTHGSYLVLGFVTEAPSETGCGVHTPLRSDGYYADDQMPLGVAEHWRKNRLVPEERIVIVKIVSDDSDHVDDSDAEPCS